MRFLVTMLLVLVPLCAQDPPPQKKGGGGGAPKNLKVLKPEEVRAAMGSYVAALGVGASGSCNFCHVADKGKDADDNPKKITARVMIAMVQDINAKLTAGGLKPEVTCYTCHRGKNEPENKAGLPLP